MKDGCNKFAYYFEQKTLTTTTQQELWQKNWQNQTQKPLSPTVTLNNKRIKILPPDQIQICFCLIKKV